MVWFYKHSNNETNVDILMFPFFYGFEVLFFIFIVVKDKNKVLTFNMMYFPYLEISVPLLLSAAL